MFLVSNRFDLNNSNVHVRRFELSFKRRINSKELTVKHNECIWGFVEAFVHSFIRSLHMPFTKIAIVSLFVSIQCESMYELLLLPFSRFIYARSNLLRRKCKISLSGACFLISHELGMGTMYVGTIFRHRIVTFQASKMNLNKGILNLFL
jgi:hypothetical protein